MMPRPRIPTEQRIAGVRVPAFLAIPVALVRLMSSAVGLGLQLVGGLFVGLIPPRLRHRALATVRALTAEPPVSDPVVVAHSFVMSFEAAYGPAHPPFELSSHKDALSQAAQQFKFLLVYLHSPEHQDTPQFCHETLCAPPVVEFLSANFLVWGGDIRHHDAYQLSVALRTTTYPFVAILSNHNSRISLLAALEGAVSAEHLLGTLTQVLEDKGAALVAARAEVEERDYNRLLRAEQDRELQESLAADRAREEARALERERLEREASEAAAAQAAQAAAEEAARKAAREAAEAVQRRRAEKAASLGAEPDPGEGITQVLIRLPDGNRQKRRFPLASPVQHVYDFVDSLESLCCNKYSLATTFPKRVYGEDSKGMSIAEAGLQDAMLIIQSEDD